MITKVLITCDEEPSVPEVNELIILVQHKNPEWLGQVMASIDWCAFS